MKIYRELSKRIEFSAQLCKFTTKEFLEEQRPGVFSS